MKDKIKEILENIIHWDTCPDDYKEDIQEYLEQLQPKEPTTEQLLNQVNENLDIDQPKTVSEKHILNVLKLIIDSTNKFDFANAVVKAIELRDKIHQRKTNK